MFGDMTPPMVRPEPNRDGYIVEPKASANTQLPPDGNVKPVITPRVSVDPDSSRAPQTQPAPAPAPQLVPPQAPVAPVVPVTPPAVQSPKMMRPIIEKPAVKREKPAAKPSAEKTKAVKPLVPPVKPTAPPVAAPTPVPEEAKTPPQQVQPAVPATPSAAPVPTPPIEPSKTTPVPRDPNESAIKGPKTMPALPAQNVDTQVTFEDKQPPATNGQTIMERHLDEVKTHEQAVPPAPKPNVAPAAFDPGNKGALKKSIPFQPGQIGLSTADIDPIVAGVNKELDGEDKKEWRVQIRAYATPYGTGVSSDRRIALSRALSLRTAMIAQGISASRIDVLAEGQQDGNAKPGDRIDLYLYGPAAD